jgi:inhibitor of cysteine peptidase
MEAAGIDSYTLTAAQGQTMWVTVTATQGTAVLVIWGADGTVMISDHADATNWSGELPSTQDYNIDVKGDPDSATVYTLQVVIPPTITGRTKEVDDGASGSEIELSAGDQLVVTLDSNPSTGYVWEIQAVDAAVLQPVGEWEYSSTSDLMGAGGKETRRFIALTPGKTSLQMEYHRPWERDASPARTFEVAVTVK